MSFLSILLFTCAFYFVHGRPDASSTAQSTAGIPEAQSMAVLPETQSTAGTSAVESTASAPLAQSPAAISAAQSPTGLPASPTQSDAGKSDVATNENNTPNVEPVEYKEQIDGFMKDLSEAVDKHVTPMMSKLDQDKQKDLKTMLLNGFYSYFNYMILMMQEKHEDKTSVNSYAQQNTDDIILEFLSSAPIADNSGLIPAQQDTVISKSEAKNEAIYEKGNSAVSKSVARAEGP